MGRVLMLVLITAPFAGCPEAEQPIDDGGVVVSDSGPADTGVDPIPDAGFGGGLGARCQRSSDCTDPSHQCYVGHGPNLHLRCTTTCVRDEQCYDFAEAAGLSRDEVACEIPANYQGTRHWCVQTPPPAPDAGPGGDAGLGDGGVAEDAGGSGDAGQGQGVGARCTDHQQCDSRRCMQGFSGDSFCSRSCTTDDDCAAYGAAAGLQPENVACVDIDEEMLCNEVPALPRVGWTADLRPGINGVSARITLMPDRQIRVRNLIYDGQRDGQEVYLAFSLGPITAESMIPISVNLRCRGGQCVDGHPCASTNGVCSEADFDLPMPEGLAYDSFDRASVVGMPQGLAWSEGLFEP